jgi:ribonuclease T2
LYFYLKEENIMATLKKILLLVFTFAIGWSFWLAPVYALIQVDDSLRATGRCEAVQSIRTGANPGNIKLAPNQTYAVVGKNQVNESHYLVQVKGANPPERWVKKQCGQLLSTMPGGNQPPAGNNNSSSSKKDYLLALSWQPAFCETKPNKTECQTQTADRFDATHLALHGLWPQPRTNIYCGVSQDLIELDKKNQWNDLPPINLSAATSQALAEKMPGFSSNLQLHEWYKHGTCYGTAPEQYFRDSIELQDQVNDSDVQKLFANSIGTELSATTIRASFDKSFGAGTGQKVAIECKRDIDQGRVNLVTELQINLAGTIKPDVSIANLLTSGKTVSPGCTRGEIDRAGLN